MVHTTTIGGETTTEGKALKSLGDGGSQEVSSAANIFGGGPQS